MTHPSRPHPVTWAALLAFALASTAFAQQADPPPEAPDAVETPAPAPEAPAPPAPAEAAEFAPEPIAEPDAPEPLPEPAAGPPDAPVLPPDAPVPPPDAAAEEAKPPASAQTAPAECCPCAETEEKAEPQLAGCSFHLKELAEAYRSAYESLQDWIPEASGKVAAVQEKEDALKARIQENEAALTELKMRDSRSDRDRIKSLARTNKDLWKELKVIGKEKSAVCRSLSQSAGQKAKDYARDIQERLKQVQTKMR
ncbi:MAG: hypothetical protein ABII00_09735 [Elusimicrobiota bacterium]